MKIYLLLMFLFFGFIATACNNSTDVAYFDMPCKNDSCSTCQNQATCDNICDTSGVRIWQYSKQNEVIYLQGKFICKCY